MRRTIASALATACFFLAFGRMLAQSTKASGTNSGGDAPQQSTATANSKNAATENKQKHKPRVWDNESIEELPGVISVVGAPASEKSRGTSQNARPMQASTVKKPIPLRPPGPKFSARTLDGAEYSNASLIGKTVLVQIWTTWCPHCQADQPAVDRLARAYSDRLVVLAVDDGEKLEKVKSYLRAAPRAVEVALSKDTNLARDLGASVYPYYVVIDRDGNLAGTLRGEAGEQRLRRLLKQSGIDDE